MIVIPQSILRECHAVFRRVAPRSSLARSATPISILAGRDGIRLRLAQADVSVEFHHPSPAESFSGTVPLPALAECEGRGNAPVEVQKTKAGIELRWEQGGETHRRAYAAQESSRTSFPSWPSRESANDPSMLQALEEAMQIPAAGASGRLALNCIQLRGKQGDIVATDGRQLLIQGGFQFPWKDAVLLPKTTIFAMRELANGQVVRVAKSDTHSFFRVGPWTIALKMETSTRFPNVDAIIPKSDHALTRWQMGDAEASALAAMLDRLPAGKEENSPVTLDLTRPVVIRARAEEEKRCTDLVLPRSSVEGKPLRVATDRRFLQRALRLGFRTVQITALDKPMLCQDGQRLFVWAPLDPKQVVIPQSNAVRVMLPIHGEKNGRPAPVFDPVSSRDPVRTIGGFFACAQNLWDLVRKHHREEQVK